VEFPTFIGEDPDSWCYRAEQFFELRIPTIHMEGKALSWFQALRANNGLSTWYEFCRAKHDFRKIHNKKENAFLASSHANA
jgi:hypothetical protein